MPKKVNPELRARAVRMVQEHQQDYPSQTAAARAVAKQLGLGRETVRRWVVQAAVDGGGRAGVTSEEHAEIKRLKSGEPAAPRRRRHPPCRHNFLRVNAIVRGAWSGFARFFAAPFCWWLVVRCAASAGCLRVHRSVA